MVKRDARGQFVVDGCHCRMLLSCIPQSQTPATTQRAAATHTRLRRLTFSPPRDTPSCRDQRPRPPSSVPRQGPLQGHTPHRQVMLGSSGQGHSGALRGHGVLWKMVVKVISGDIRVHVTYIVYD